MNTKMIYYLKNVKYNFQNCTVIDDRGYIGVPYNLIYLRKLVIRLEVPYRSDQKDWKFVFTQFAKAREMVETLFAQLYGPFMIIGNYAKQIEELLTKVMRKISKFTIFQNKINNKLIDKLNMY